MPNLFAKFVMASWPIVVLTIFALRRNTHPVARTTTWVMLLGAMFLPCMTTFDLPVFPAFDKLRMTVVWVWISILIFHRDALLKSARLHNIPRLLAIASFYGAVRTVATNSDPLVYGGVVIPAHDSKDFLSEGIGIVVDLYLPFSLGQRVFKSERDLRDLAEVFLKAFLVYVPFMLYEVKMAPVLHDTIYGFSPFGFVQAIRAGGYRVNVFMMHGLTLAVFVFAVIMFAHALQLSQVRLRPFTPRAMFWIALGMMLLACRSVGPTMYLLVAYLLIRKPPGPKKVFIFSWLVVLLVMLYPWSRAEGEFPTHVVADWAKAAGEERVQSLQFRFDNEDILLARAMERPWYGWGNWGRNRVYDENGKDVSVTDGTWILALGIYGYWGFFTQFAFVVLPLIRAAWTYKRVRASAKPLLSAVIMIVGFLSIDLLPNSRQDNWSILLGGALYTLCEMLSRPEPKRAKESAPEPEPGPNLEPSPA